MNDTRNIILPEPTLRRLPWYLAYIDILRARGVATVSSTAISHAIDVDASQIAKDLSFLNIKGKTRIGYDTETLSQRISQFLGFRHTHNAVVLGAGSLGAALMHDSGLENYGLRIVAAFDINPSITGNNVNGIHIYPLSELKGQCERLQATIGILTVPADRAQEMADTLVAAGIRAIWNFTPYRIRVRAGIAMANTSIYAHLALIYNRMEAVTTKT